MTSIVRGKIRIGKDGRVRFEKPSGYTSKNRQLKAARLEKKWRAASKTRDKS